MPKSSLEELKGQIAAGQYAVDASVLAGDILSKLALIGRVRRLLMGEDEQGREGEPGRAAWPRRERGSGPAARRRSQRGERLP